jgi:N-acetylmuramic acid 6-phosphate etherase
LNCGGQSLKWETGRAIFPHGLLEEAVMSNATKKAEEFLNRQRAFRLGDLVTEAFHPKTMALSQTAATDLPAAIRLLQSVDDDIPPAMEKVFRQDSFRQLVDAFSEALDSGNRIYFTGCGATGRLSILLEAAWRRFCYAIDNAHAEMGQDMADRVYSVMAGGDFALIKSVEGYEDFPDFGRRQLREMHVRPGDVVVAISEGGETPFVIGTAWEGLDVASATAGETPAGHKGGTPSPRDRVFFVYNNPTEVLRRHVQRSREVIEEPRIIKLDLSTGPMAITGSTRMQATTAELLVVGAALEMALTDVPKASRLRIAGETPATRQRRPGDYHRLFCELLKQLSSPQAVDALTAATTFEENVYRRGGLVTYAADALLLDVLTDTTERSPTFMLPAFRKRDDNLSPRSWAFVKDPFRPTEEAWRQLLQRRPRGLDWGHEVYEELNGPAKLKAQPPKLDNTEIYTFMIGNEPDASRTDAPDSALVAIAAGGEADRFVGAALDKFGSQYKKTAAIVIGPANAGAATDETFYFPCRLADSPLQLWHHLAVKLILNTLSTATMVRMGRVIGNAMVWLSPSNKKLVDRGSRLIAQQTGCTYERACIALHEAMEEVQSRQQRGDEVPSPVALAIERLQDNPDQSR